MSTIGRKSVPPDNALPYDGVPSLRALQKVLQGKSLAILLYGSRARGRPRQDSDVDILQLVESRPRSYSVGHLNIASYTPDHLSILAKRGSLFVRHLRDEGVVLDDPSGLFSEIFEEYSGPHSYEALKRELRVILAASSMTDSEIYQAGILRASIYAARSALYVRGAESGNLIFDTDLAAVHHGVPELARLLRTDDPEHAAFISSLGTSLLQDEEGPVSMPSDLASLALWAKGDHPLAFKILEAVIAGKSEIDYTSLTLPPC